MTAGTTFDLSIEGNVDDRERTLESAYVSALIDDAIAEGIPSDKILLVFRKEVSSR